MKAEKSIDKFTLALIIFLILNLSFFTSSGLLDLYEKIAFFILPIYLIFLIIFIANNCRINKADFLLILIMLSYFCFTLPITQGGLGSVLAPLYYAFLLAIMRNMKIGAKEKRFFLLVFLSAFLLSIIRCPSYFNVWDKTRNGINPNTLAFILSYGSMGVLTLIRTKKTSNTVISILIIILSLYGITEYSSRASLLTFLCFLMFRYLFPATLKQKYNFVRLVVVGIIIFGLIFPYIYTYSAEIIDNSANLNSIAKAFSAKNIYSGRERIWANFYNEMRTDCLNYIIGIGSKANIMGTVYEGTVASPHSLYILLLMNFGTIGFVLYFTFMLLFVKRTYENQRLNTIQIDFLFAGIALLFLGIFETMSLWWPTLLLSALFWGLGSAFWSSN